jgi:S-adenosyl-L-methionine hydrolase (adenosine-forming)
MKKIVTLITDFRASDGYMGAVFGVLKSINAELDIITVAANIPPADIRKAAQVLSNSYRFYPEGTIHLVVVDPTVGPQRRALLIDDGRYYFLGPDNGVFTPVFESSPDIKIYHITNDKYRLASGSETFHGRDLFAPVAAYLSLGVPPDEFGAEIDDPELMETPEPEKFGRDIIGKVIDIDAFGNLVTNIPADMLSENSTIAICGRIIRGLSKSYADVPEKQPLAYIGSSGNLEIAINRGNAANYFGALIFEEIKIIGGAD